jgi:hypothetical protein
MRTIYIEFLVFNKEYPDLLKLALKLQKYFSVTKVQIKVVLLPLNIKRINIDEKEI